MTELFPISSLGPERQVLPHLPRRDPPRDGNRPLLLPTRLGADLPRDGSGPEGNGIRGQALVAALAAALAAYVSVRFLMRYFETRTLIPFAIWSLVFGLACSIYFATT